MRCIQDGSSTVSFWVVAGHNKFLFTKHYKELQLKISNAVSRRKPENRDDISRMRKLDVFKIQDSYSRGLPKGTQNFEAFLNAGWT